MWKNILKKVPFSIYIKLSIPLIFTSIFNVVISVLFQIGINSVIHREGLSQIIIISGTLVLSSVFYIPIYYYQKIQIEKFKLYISESFGEMVFKDIMVNNSNLSKNLKEGKVINLIHEDINNLSFFLDRGLFPLLSLLITLVTGIIYVLSQSFLIGGIFIAVGILFAITNRYMAKIMNEHYADYIQFDDDYKNTLEQFYYLIPLMRFLKLDNWINKKHSEKHYSRQTAYSSYWHRYTQSYAITEGGIIIFESLVLIFGLYLVQKSILELGSLIGAWNAGLGSILYPLSTLPAMYSYYARYLSSVRRIKGKTGSNFNVDFNLLSSESSNYAIYIQNLVLKYSNQNNILTNFNAKISEVGIHYIVGPSGSGKTTLIKALLGIIPITSGRIVNNRGKNVIGKNMTYVPQVVHLFNISIRDNLTLGSKNITEESIIDICKRIKIWDKIKTLPKQLDTIIGEENALSKGEIRRIGIARAILSDEQFILMDEPFSDLDLATQNVLLKEFKHLSRHKSLVIISHDLKFITETDNVIRVGVPYGNY